MDFQHTGKGSSSQTGTVRHLAWTCAALLLGLGHTPDAHAHGELLIRIAEVSAKIANATNETRLYLERAELYRQDCNWPAATADLDRSAEIDPQLTVVDLHRGRLLADEGKLSAARAALDRYIQHAPTDGNGYIERARVLVRSGQRREAVADFTRGLNQLTQPQPEYFMERAFALLAEDQAEAAVQGLDEAIRRLGPLVSLQALALDVEVRQKKFDAALARLETIIPQVPRPENWLTRRGEIQLAVGRPKAAVDDFNAASSAIEKLPPRLQQLPPLLALKARIKSGLEKATATGSAPGTTPTSDAGKPHHRDR